MSQQIMVTDLAILRASQQVELEGLLDRHLQQANERAAASMQAARDLSDADRRVATARSTNFDAMARIGTFVCNMLRHLPPPWRPLMV